jgi:D-3-phosphoglycerate dehydrogenase
LQKLSKVVASPHIAASTREGQELVGVETASALRDFLKSGVIRNAVNFPTVPADEFQRLSPTWRLASSSWVPRGQMGEAH